MIAAPAGPTGGHRVARESRYLASFAVVVPAWTLVAVFVVGVAIGAGVTRVLMGRGAPAQPVEPAPVETPPAEPEPAASVPAPPPPAAAPVAAEVVAPPEATAEPAVAEAAEVEPAVEAEPAAAEPAPAEAAAAEPSEEGKADEPAAAGAEGLTGGVEDVVAELERRYKGRRADGEAEQQGKGRGQRS
jgi:type IV secretory pathway VirB10-like protein